MARSLKKGPFVDLPLLKKVEIAAKSSSKKPIKTWSRRSMIIPRHGRADHCGTQWQAACPGGRQREHGRAQARRVRGYAHFQGSFWRQEVGEISTWKRRQSCAPCASRRRRLDWSLTWSEDFRSLARLRNWSFSSKRAAHIIRKVSAVRSRQRRAQCRRRRGRAESGPNHGR